MDRFERRTRIALALEVGTSMRSRPRDVAASSHAFRGSAILPPRHATMDAEWNRMPSPRTASLLEKIAVALHAPSGVPNVLDARTGDVRAIIVSRPCEDRFTDQGQTESAFEAKGPDPGSA